MAIKRKKRTLPHDQQMSSDLVSDALSMTIEWGHTAPINRA